VTRSGGVRTPDLLEAPRVADREKLHLGRARPRPGSGPRRAPKASQEPSRPRPKPPEDATRFERIVFAVKVRRAAKKRRLAKMTRKRRVARRFGIAGTWFLGFIATLVIAAVIAFYTFGDVPRPETLALPQVAEILYSDGSVMAKFGDQNRTIVSIDKVPEAVRYDILAAEDRNFYSESGVSIRGTVRAALSDVTGGDTQGGSGITQQYVKNAYLNDSRSLSRKLKELVIAVKLSREYSKDQILEFYLNTVYFGRGAYGIEAAAQAFFGKDVNQLSLTEGAVLAAQLRAPSYYDPAVNPQAAHERWKYVLDGMVATKHLTQAQEDLAVYPTVIPPKDDTVLGTDGNTYLIEQQVLAELAAHGITKDDVSNRGLRIQTTIDKNAQNAALSAIHTEFANLTAKQKNIKNALIAINPATGGVLAYYGGSGPGVKNYAGTVDYNDYASVGVASPGSSFKPYTLATALTQTLAKQGSTTISSQVFGGYTTKIGNDTIQNDPGDKSLSHKTVTVAYAMKYSLNTTFDLMAEDVGPPNVKKTAVAMGIPATINGTPSLVDGSGNTDFGIGIGDYKVHPIDQAIGYATLANSGEMHPSYFVQKATDSSGNVVYSHTGKGTKAIDPKVANDVTLTMEPIAKSSGFALAGGRTSAAKTGTEGIFQDPNGNNSDAWTVGYTPQVAAAVWVGSGNSTTPIYNSSGSPEYGKDLPGKTWKLFMDTYLKGKPDLPMATKQMIGTGIDLTKPSNTPSTSASTSPSTSASTSPSSGTSSSPSGAPSTGTSSTSSTPTTPPTSPTPTCVSTILHQCPSGAQPSGG
jgi:membrane peptidoglycan carboxypeptidase